MPEALSIQDLIRREAASAGVPPELALAVAEQESSFNPTAFGRPIDQQGTRAIGTFQLLPQTASMLGVDPNDPLQNVQGGVRYLRQLLDQHQGDLNQVLATYGGVKTDRSYVPSVLGRLDKFRGVPAPTPMVGRDIAPTATFAEQHPYLNAFIQGLDPHEAEGRRNIAGAIGGAIGGGLGTLVGPWGTVAGSAAGAALGGGLEQLLLEETGAGQALSQFLPGKTDIAEPPPAPDSTLLGRAARVGGEQAVYDVLGQAVFYPVRAVGRAALQTPVGRAATTYFEGAKRDALASLYGALDSMRNARDAFRVTAAEGARTLGAQTAAATATERAAAERALQATRTGVGERVAEVRGARRPAIREAAAESRVGIDRARAEAEAVEEATRQALQQGIVASAPPETAAGRAVAEVFEGPGQAARDLAGQAVKEAAKSGPDISITDLKKEAERIMVEELLPPEQAFPRQARPEALRQALPEGVVEGEIVGQAPPRPAVPWSDTDRVADLWQQVLDDAKAQGYSGPPSRLRAAFNTLMEDPAKGARALQAEMTAPHPDRRLLREVAANGGIGGIGPGDLFEGEFNWLRQGGKGGRIHDVPGVVKPKGGLTFEAMAERLRQIPGYERFTSGKELVDELTSIAQRGIPESTMTLGQAAEVAGIRPGEPWWQPIFQEQYGSLSQAITRAQQQELIKHPAMGVVSRILNAPDTVDFYTAHLWKSQLQQALSGSYDDVVKSQATNITQHLAGLLRGALGSAEHAPYEAATKAYADVARLFTEGHAPVIREMARSAPEKIAQAIDPDSPTAASMLVQVLTQQAELGGGAAGRQQGQEALRLVQDAWIHRNVLQGSIEGIPDRIAALRQKPEFMAAFLNTPFARDMLQQAEVLGAALRHAQAQGAERVATATQAGRAGVRAAAERGEQRLAAARRVGAQEIRGARAAGRGRVAAAEAAGAKAVETEEQATAKELLQRRQEIRGKGAEIRTRRAGTPEERAFAESTLGRRAAARSVGGRQLEWAARAALAGQGMSAFGPAGILLGSIFRSAGRVSDADLLRYVSHSKPLTQAVVKLLYSPAGRALQQGVAGTATRGVGAVLGTPTSVLTGSAVATPPPRP
jgi:hypothetical protein